MREGRSLQAVAAEVERQAASKKDYIAPTAELTMLTTQDANSELILKRHGDYTVAPLAHQQIATHLGIPQKFYDRLRQRNTGLLDVVVNRLFRDEPSTQMVRTLDGKVRAFLSDKYRPLDYVDLMRAIVPVLAEMPEVKFPSVEITDTRLYLKAVLPRIQGEVKVGDVVQAGVVITDSEVGLGKLDISPMVYRLACRNGMISGSALRRYHVGKRITGGDGDDPYEYFSDETRQADDRAFWLKARDTVRAAVTETTFNRLLDNLRDAAGSEPIERPTEGIRELAKRFSFTEGEQEDVLGFLVRGGDLSKYGTLNAVTSYSQTVDDYDIATNFEKIGGAILALDNSEWLTIARAK